MIFEAYVEQVVVATLRPGEIVIMDDLPAHRRPTIRAVIEAAGAVLRHLPLYSPHFNPIENAFASSIVAAPSSGWDIGDL